MDFVSLVVITDIDNWVGSFFENFLDAFCQEETLDNPKYQDFKTDSLSKVSSFLWVILNFLPITAMSAFGFYGNIEKLCPNLEYYQYKYDQYSEDYAIPNIFWLIHLLFVLFSGSVYRLIKCII